MSDRIKGDEVYKIGMRGYKEVLPYNWHGKMIEIRYILPRDEEIELVHSILRCCGLDEMNNGFIIPEFLEPAIRANIVTAYTNADLPNSIDEQQQLLYCSDLYDVVMKTVNGPQVNNIINSVKMYV